MREVESERKAARLRSVCETRLLASITSLRDPIWLSRISSFCFCDFTTLLNAFLDVFLCNKELRRTSIAAQKDRAHVTVYSPFVESHDFVVKQHLP